MTALQTVCPHCAALNRLPVERLSDAPNCGKCHQPLFGGVAQSVTDAQFQRLLDKEQLPLVVDFWADWCGPCKAFAPVFAEAAAQLEPRARFIKINTEQAQQTAARYAIRSIPTLMVIKSGEVVAQQAGALPAQAFAQWLNTQL